MSGNSIHKKCEICDRDIQWMKDYKTSAVCSVCGRVFCESCGDIDYGPICIQCEYEQDNNPE